MSTLTEAAEQAQFVGDAAQRLGGQAECPVCQRLVSAVRCTVAGKHPGHTVYARHDRSPILRQICRGSGELVALG